MAGSAWPKRRCRTESSPQVTSNDTSSVSAVTTAAPTLAPGASRVSMLRDARIQVLSPAALAALDKAADREDETLSAALSAGAVDSAFPAKSPA